MDKKFIDGLIIKEKTLTGVNGEFSIMNASINIEELFNSLGAIATTDRDGKQWANITIKKRSEPSQSGVTHYAVPNDYKPKGDTSKNKITADDIPETLNADNVPF